MNRYGGQPPDLRVGVQFTTSQGRLIVLTDEGVECLRASDGSLLWRSAPAGAAPVQEALVPQDRMSVAGSRVYLWRPAAGRVCAMDFETGRLIWETEVPQPTSAPVNPNNPWQAQDLYVKLRSGLSVDQGKVLAWAQSAALLSAETGAVIWRTGTGELPSFPIGLETEEELASASTSLLAASTTLLQSVQQTFGASASPRMPGMPSTRNLPNQRWAYGDALRRMTQAQGGIAPSLLLRGDEVWGVTANGECVVSLMGLPMASWAGSGMVVGIEGRRIASDMGGSATVTTVGNPSRGIPLFPDSEGIRLKEPTNTGAAGVPWSGSGTYVVTSGSIIIGPQVSNVGADLASVFSSVLEGNRFYSTTPERLRAADVRSGAVLFDLPWPSDAVEWGKTESSRSAAAVVPPLPGMGGRGMASQYRRVYVPQGVFLQDQRGGGILCGPLAAVAEDLWIAPLQDRVVICLRGQFQKPVANTAPVNASPVSVR
jgi:hypothetical protein